MLKVLEAMGQKPTEEELFQMISEVDDNMSGSIDFPEFLKVCLLRVRATGVLHTISLCTSYSRNMKEVLPTVLAAATHTDR